MASQTILISGASSGIGLATARLFLAKGWNVVAGMRRPEGMSPTDAAAGMVPMRLDVTNALSMAEAVKSTVSRFGAIDVLVNNAGYALMGPAEGLTRDALRDQFETNVFGLIELTQEVLPVMRRQGAGTIVNISSIGGRMAFPFASAYHSTKFAVEGFSESLRYELKGKGIRVKLVEPGGIKTNFIHKGTRWDLHPAYEPETSKFKAMADRMNDNLPGPEATARVVYSAATDRGDRLRYLASAGPYPLLNGALPDAIWRRVVGLALRGHASRSNANPRQEERSA